MGIDKKIAAITADLGEELGSVKKVSDRRPYLLAMLMRGIVAEDIAVGDVKHIAQGLSALGHVAVVGKDPEDLLHELLELADRVPESDDDTDPKVVEEIRGQK